MKKASIDIKHDISQINIYPNEVITIWIYDSRRDFRYDKAVHLEIRKNSDGEIEIFSSDENIVIKSFNDWTR
jgi:hypothetical protein